MNSKREIFEACYQHCQQAGKKDKGKILDEAAGTTGLNCGHLAPVPTSCEKKRTVKGEARLGCGKREQGRRGGRRKSGG